LQAFDNEEYIPGVCCLAAPVRYYTNKVCAALSVAISSVRLNNRDISFIVRDLINTADNIFCQIKNK
jgi:DNA-binding IclR family transcriptional regulator